MRKLGKKVVDTLETVEAYSCYCSRSACICSCTTSSLYSSRQDSNYLRRQSINRR